MRALNKLAANAVAALPAGKHEDGGGLRMVKLADGGGFWVFRFSLYGRRREMGLGSLQAVTLKAARLEASKARGLIAKGVDPIAQRDRDRDAAMNHAFEAVARSAFESRKAQLKGDGTPARWFSPLENHVLPRIGRVPLSQITQRDIVDCLRPIWHEKAATASKALDRIGIALKHGAALGLDVDLNAVMKARALLGAQRHTVKHHAAMPWAEVPAYYMTLGETVASLALRLTILTGARSGSIRALRLEDIDFEAKVWTVPANDMKAGREWRCPLSDEALRVIQLAMPFECDGLLFAGTKGRPISDMTMSAVLRRAGRDERPHGFRTSLRVWLAECTDAPHEVAELCLAHESDSTVVRAYRRTDYLEQRAALLQRWADLVTGKGAAVVLPMVRA